MAVFTGGAGNDSRRSQPVPEAGLASRDPVKGTCPTAPAKTLPAASAMLQFPLVLRPNSHSFARANAGPARLRCAGEPGRRDPGRRQGHSYVRKPKLFATPPASARAGRLDHGRSGSAGPCRAGAIRRPPIDEAVRSWSALPQDQLVGERSLWMRDSRSALLQRALRQVLPFLVECQDRGRDGAAPLRRCAGRVVAFLRALMRLVPMALCIPPQRLQGRARAGGRLRFRKRNPEGRQIQRSAPSGVFSSEVDTGPREENTPKPIDREFSRFE